MRIRLEYRKLGRAAYRGHLDLVRVLPRILRRVGAPLHFTQGFHPKPEMVFGPALALGTASLAEHIDVKLDASVPFDLDTLLQRLNAVSESGLEFVNVVRLGPEDPGIHKVIDESVYVVGLPRALGFDVDAVRSRVEARLARAQQGEASLTVVRRIDGVGKKVDVSSYLAELAVGVGAEDLERAGIAGQFVPLRFRLRVTSQGATKPAEVIEALLDAPDIAFRAVRTFQGLGGISPMDLPRLRESRRRSAISESVATAEARPSPEGSSFAVETRESA